MLTPDEAVKIPPVLDLPPAPPPKFKAIMQRIPIQGGPRIVSIKKRSSGSYCVLLMEEQRKPLGGLQTANVETYLPMHYVVKEINGKRKLVHEPLLPNIIFARMTREKSHEFVKEPAITAKWLKYYTDKTKPIEKETGKNPPVTITDNEMLNFIKLTSVNSEHIMVLPPERCHFKSGDLVRVVEGAFTGVVGRVGRAAGQQRVFVVLEGVCNVATAYIPNDFIQIIETF